MRKPDWVASGPFDRLCLELKTGDVVVWVGAGLSIPCDYPSWVEWLRKSAVLLREQERDDLLANLMERHVDAGNLLLAADLLFDHWQVADGSRWQLLEQSLPKSPKPCAAHRVLVELPVETFITTNYDSLIEDAFAAVHLKSLSTFSNSDDQIKSAERWGAESICHIHGRWKEWESIVFSTRHYNRIKESAVYQQFIRSTIGTRPLILLGYGGMDPDINGHLQWIAQNAGKRRPRFWIGNEPSAATRDLLVACDVEVIAYPAGQHQLLLELLSSLPTRNHVQIEPSTASAGTKDELIRFAVFLSGRRWGRAIDNGVDAALALSSVRSEEDYASSEALARRIQVAYRLAPSTASEIASRGIRVLSKFGRRFELEAEEVKRSAAEVSPAIRLMAKVVEVACGVSSFSSKIPALAQEALSTLLMADGLAMSFQLAGMSSARRSPPLDAIRSRAADLARDARAPNGFVDALISSIFIVLKSNDEEVRADLVRLARAAFLLNARFIGGDLIHKAKNRVLQPLYLDANVLLPMLVSGFPTGKSLSCLMRLARDAGVELRFLRGFANEIRSHRDQALAFWKNQLHSSQDELVAYLAATVPLGGNVYLRGFGGSDAVSFDDYLDENRLVFRSDDDVIQRLLGEGYKLVDCRGVRARRQGRIAQIQEALIAGKKYEGRFRAATVCEHEAVQLAQVEMDTLDGAPSLFLTHDRALYRVACQIQGGDLAALIQDPRVLGYLLANENRAVDASMAPLLFGIVEADPRSAVMSLATEKIVERIVSDLDEFETLAVPEAYQKLVDAVESESDRSAPEDAVAEKVAEGRIAIGRVDETIEAMLEVAERRRQQHMGTSSAVATKHSREPRERKRKR